MSQKQYQSGSVEEIRQLIARGARVLVYFSKQSIPQEHIDQYEKMSEFKKEIRNEGLLGKYSDIHNLKEQVLLHLTKILVDLLSKDRPGIGQLGKPIVPSLEKPDIRVKTKPGVISSPGEGRQDVITIEVQNHSPMVVFTGMFEIELKNQYSLIIPFDPVTGDYQRRRELRPGESFSFHVLPGQLFDKVRPDEVLKVVVKDDIERTYESDPENLQWVLNELWKKYKKMRSKPIVLILFRHFTPIGIRASGRNASN